MISLTRRHGRQGSGQAARASKNAGNFLSNALLALNQYVAIDATMETTFCSLLSNQASVSMFWSSLTRMDISSDCP